MSYMQGGVEHDDRCPAINTRPCTCSADLDPKYWGPEPTAIDRVLSRLYGWLWPIRKKLHPPWWFCNGWWSPWCVLDTIAHDWFRLSMPADDDSDHWVCRKHYESVEREP